MSSFPFIDMSDAVPCDLSLLDEALEDDMYVIESYGTHNMLDSDTSAVTANAYA